MFFMIKFLFVSISLFKSAFAGSVVYMLVHFVYYVGILTLVRKWAVSFILREKSSYLEIFWSVFSGIWTEYGELFCKSPDSVRIRENKDQKNSKYEHFLRSVIYTITIHFLCFLYSVITSVLEKCFWISRRKYWLKSSENGHFSPSGLHNTATIFWYHWSSDLQL